VEQTSKKGGFFCEIKGLKEKGNKKNAHPILTKKERAAAIKKKTQGPLIASQTKFRSQKGHEKVKGQKAKDRI